MSKNQDTKQGQGGQRSQGGPQREQDKVQAQPNKGQPGPQRQDARGNTGTRSKSSSN